MSVRFLRLVSHARRAVAFAGLLSIGSSAALAEDVGTQALMVAPSGTVLSSAAYQDYKTKTCGTAKCAVDFQVVPAKSRLEISNASCLATTSSNYPNYIQLQVLKKNGGLATAVTLPLGYPATPGGVVEWSTSEPVQVFALAGQHVRAEVAFVPPAPGTVISLACSIGGHLLTLAN